MIYPNKKERDSSKVLTAFCLLMALKPISDMFWAVSVFDLALLLFSFCLLVYGLFSYRTKFCFVDCAAFCLFALIFLSAVKSDGGLAVGAKMLSAIMLYFIGRIYWQQFRNVTYWLKLSFGLVVFVNFALLLSGGGFQAWGGSTTFTGLYYFKTDLACAMGTAIILYLFLSDSAKTKLLVCAAAGLMLILSNTRAYYVIILLVIVLFVGFKTKTRISGRTILAILAAIIAILYFLNWVFSTGIFSSLGFITFHFNSLDELLDSSNTQGRNVVWGYIMNIFQSSDLLGKLFGIDLVSDQVFVNGGSYGSHSLYIGMLFNVGYVGVLLMVLFFLCVYRNIERIEDKRMGYFFLALLIQFLVSGLSAHVFQFTANSWICFAMFGIAVSYSRFVASEERVIPLVCS